MQTSRRAFRTPVSGMLQRNGSFYVITLLCGISVAFAGPITRTSDGTDMGDSGAAVSACLTDSDLTTCWIQGNSTARQKYLYSDGAPTRWPRSLMRWFYNPAGQPSWTNTNSALSIIATSMNKWSSVCGIRFEYAGLASNAVGQYDGANVIGWGHINQSAGGIAYTSAYPNGAIVDSDIQIDAQQLGAAANYLGVMTHEVGHSVGLAHSNVSSSIMYATPYHEAKYDETLRNDDIAGCVSLYGMPGSLVDGTCGSSSGATLENVPNGLCSMGTPSNVISSGGIWAWSCGGLNNGDTASCSAKVLAHSTASSTSSSTGGSAGSTSGGSSGGGSGGSSGGIWVPRYRYDGTCGSSSGVAVLSRPTTELCSIGSASGVTGDGPWTWSCSGAYGGNSASCIASMFVANRKNECLFNWAEHQYPSLFHPSGAVSKGASTYYYRYYATTNTYLAVSTGSSHVYYLGPESSGKTLDVGELSVWLATAGCS